MIGGIGQAVNGTLAISRWGDSEVFASAPVVLTPGADGAPAGTM
jgi:hypothetical protein